MYGKHTLENMPQRKAFGCFNERSKIKKSFFNCPRPDCSVQARNTCQAWLLNLRNASLPREIDDYVWKRADLVCEDHFAPHSFDRINNDTFASELAKSELQTEEVFETRCSAHYCEYELC